MSLIQRIASLSARAFTGAQAEATSFERLREALNKLKLEDIGLFGMQGPAFTAPCGYMPVMQHDKFTMCVFLLKEGERIPLHNHPSMTGLLKVLLGKLRLRAFTVPTPLNAELGEVVKGTFASESIVNSLDPAQVLYPKLRNVHEIHAVENSVFIDILAPPYSTSDGRDCTYFEELSEKISKSDPKQRSLRVIEAPIDFWTESLTYRGPRITL